MYENIAESLIGKIRLCHPVNDKSTKFSKSRDIKPNPRLYHYTANTRQYYILIILIMIMMTVLTGLMLYLCKIQNMVEKLNFFPTKH